jgi:MYXO-CTERM domain-containing protein
MTTRTIATVALVAAVALAAGSASADSVGVNTHVPAPAVVDLASDAGMKWIRVDNNWLSQTDPCSASIGWEAALDTAVSHAQTQGLCVYMTLAYTPACASLGNVDGLSSNNDVPDPTKWASYVRQAVAHYRALGVRHFGLWNEPNLGGFFEGTVQQYVSNVLVPGFPAVHQGCQDAGHDDCLVLGPELAHVGDNVDEYLETVLNSMTTGGLRFDIITHHIYQGFDTPIYSGDSFLNALEAKRWFSNRRSLLEVLEDTGLAPGGVPVTEVWITETGYQCSPATDATEMATQQETYKDTLDAMLARAWWTNVFFYEILDSGDSLDGYGITRNDGSGGYIKKPAWTYLQTRIAATPELRDSCTSPVVPPTPKTYTAARGTPVIDGELADWVGANYVGLQPPGDYVIVGADVTGIDDLKTSFALRWDPQALYLAVLVDDEAQANGYTEPEIWMGDSLQVAFDMAHNGGSSYDATDDYEFAWAKTSTGDVRHRFYAPNGAPAAADTFAITRNGTTTTYEVRIPATDLGLSTFTAGKVFGFSLLVNDNDGTGRDGFLQWTPGIGQAKNPGLYGEVTLADTAPPTDGGVGDGGAHDGGAHDGPVADGGAGDGAAQADGGAGGDAGGDNPSTGCGCRAADPGAASLFTLALAALLVGARRRRR